MSAPVYVDKKVLEALEASDSVQAVCAKRVYPLKIPQGMRLPAVVLQRTYSSPDYTLQGYGSECAVLMVNSFALTWDTAKKLALAVRSVMSAKPLKAILRNETDLYEDTTGVFCISAEYVCQQRGGYPHE